MDRAATIEGILDHVVFANEENGYTIARLQEPGNEDQTTVVGTLMGVREGDNLQLHGAWTEHPKYGRQFKFESFRVVPPSTLKGIERYLGSGAIKGIGKKTAERLVGAFGMETLEVIEKEPERLREVQGLGKKKIRDIVASFREQHAQQEVMVFLQSYGVTTGQAHRIIEQYGDNAITEIRSNPYQLSKDILGIGFRTADKIAQNLGIPPHAAARMDAGILYVLDCLADDGHVCCPKDQFLNHAHEILEVDPTLLDEALQRQVSRKSVIIDGSDPPMVYRASHYTCEVSVAERLNRLRRNRSALPNVRPDRAIEWFEESSGLQLAAGQKKAIEMALTERVSVITGGPGVGKTTIVKAILQILEAKTVSVVLAAPTGRAAKRLAESTGREAKTLHRLLRFNPALHRFEADEKNPLEGQVFIIDECSMIDIVLMHHFLKALPGEAHVVFVGDADQLPSVGPGNVLSDILDSGRIRAARLDVIFRQAARSTIIDWAHAINRGTVPKPPPRTQELSDLYFVEKENPEEILKLILTLCAERIPQRFSLNAVHDVQVLTPMHKGVLGVTNLNRELQRVLNPRSEGARATPSGLHEGDKVMQIRNNYEKDVFNGDIGRVTLIDPVDGKVTIRFDNREVEYSFGSLSEVSPAYAISVHKSQGSEYPAVVLPLVTQHFVLLQRNLLYTAITRARRLVVIIGTELALRIAVRSETVRSRFTGLCERLRSESPHPLAVEQEDVELEPF